MAISYINVDIVRRSRGDNSLEAAAYRSRFALFDRSIGKTFSYENLGNAKKDLIHSNILLPDSAFSDEYNRDNHPLKDRESLWNAIEDIENGHNRRADAQLAIDLTLALPKELSAELNIKLAEQFVREHYVDKHNVIADINIHDEGDGNPHAHVMITFREIKGVEFSKKKIRTITPQLYKVNGKELVRQDQIVGKYTNFQNRFFKENNVELVVDQTGIISGIHMSRNGYHGGFNKDDLAESKKIEQANADIVSNDGDAIIDTLSYRQSTFNKFDIQSLVYKCTLANPDKYDETLDNVLSSKRLINLGFSTAGRETYTTKENYQNDIKLLDVASELEGRRSLSVSKSNLVDVAKEKTLKSEQFRAIRHITDSGDISCLVGYAGAGKTYAMSALNEVYSRSGIKVYGTSISGKAVQGLQDEAGIQSQTIAKMIMNYRLGRFGELPNKNSVLVIDEVGMVGIDDMLALQQIAKERHLKLVLVGDPMQLESISRGNPFKAILEQVGFAVMKSITRQKDDHDKNATVWLGQGKTGMAIDHYAEKGNVHIQSSVDNHQAIIDKFDTYLDNGFNVSDTLMLAFTRRDVAMLNEKARDVLVNRDIINSGVNIRINLSGKDNKDRSIKVTDNKNFSAGDRIMFLKGAKLQGLEVKNSLFANIQSIEGNIVTVITDENKPRSISFDVTKYNHFDYGYAATVHRSQGATVQNVINYVSSNNWNSHLTYVTMTRHKLNMDFYVDDNVYGNIDDLRKGLSSRSSKEFNVLDFVEKREANKIMDTLRRYMVYEMPDYEIKSTNNANFSIVAELADLNREVGRDYYKLLGDNKELSDDSRELLHSKWAYRDRLAFIVSQDIDKYKNAIELNALDKIDIFKWSENHLSTIQFDRFVAADNLLYKGKIVEDISQTQRGRVLLSQNKLWNEHNQAVSAYKLHKLVSEDRVLRDDVKLVERYLSSRELAYKYYKKSQAEVFADKDIVLFKGSVFERSVKQSELTSKEYLNLSNKVNKKGDLLAYTISQDLEQYKDILEAKYTGKMFDSVMESIQRQANYHILREDVDKYSHAKGLTREQFAYKITSNGKQYARFVAEAGIDWKELNKDSRRLSLEAWKNDLGDSLKPVFDAIKSYKEINIEIAQLLSQGKLEERTQQEKDDISMLVVERNTKANNLLFKQGLIKYRKDDEFLKTLYPSGIDVEKLFKQYESYKSNLIAKQTVQDYVRILADKSDDPAIGNMAHAISGRYASHAKYLREFNVDIRELGKRARNYQLHLDNNKFIGIDKQIHREIANYVIARNEAASAWREARLTKDESVGLKELKAKYLSQNRNELAYKVSKSLGQNISSKAYNVFYDQKRGELDLQQILNGAAEHELFVKLEDYKKLNPLTEESMALAKEISLSYSKGAVYHTITQLKVESRVFYADIKAYDRATQEEKQFTKVKADLDLYNKVVLTGIKEYTGRIADRVISNKDNLKFLDRAGVDYNSINIDALEYRLENYRASKDARIIDKFDFEKINSSFKQEPNNYKYIFGSKTKETAKNISFGNFTVSKQSGKWWDENQNTYRDPTEAMMKVHGVRHKQTGENYAEFVGKVAGLSKNDLRIKELVDPVKNQLQNELADFKEKVQKQKAVQMLWDRSKPLQGSIADRYLKEHRGIADTSSLAMRYVPKGTDVMLSSGKIKPAHAPMLLVGGYNHKGDIVSAQRIYLDENTANKNTKMDNAKLSMGLVSGSGGLVQKGSSDRVYIVEGPETGASIAIADKEASVYCSFGLGNLSKLDKLIKANNFKEVILAADNDGIGSNAEKLTKEATDRLHNQGVDIKVIEPESIEGLVKTDWNDVLKFQSIQKIQSQLGINIEYSQEHKKAKALLDEIEDTNRKIEKLIKKAKVFDNNVVFKYLSDEDKRDVKFAAGAVTEYERQREKLLKGFSVSQHKMPESIKQTEGFKKIRQQSFDYHKEQHKSQGMQKNIYRDLDSY